MIWRLLLVGLLGTHLWYNFECVANRATGSWMHCVRPLNFVFEKRLGRNLVGVKLAGQFVEISIFSEQGEHSPCLPKS